MPAYLLIVYETDNEGRRLMEAGDVRIYNAIEMAAELKDSDNADCQTLAEELQVIIDG